MATFEQLQRNAGYQADPRTPPDPQGDGLTASEGQVLGLLAQGLATEEIAGKLTISPSTVRNHVQNILGKLGVHSRLEAIAYAYQHGLIESNGS